VLEILGVTPEKLVFLFFYLLLLIIIFFAFLIIGIQALSISGSSFSSTINSTFIVGGGAGVSQSDSTSD